VFVIGRNSHGNWVVQDQTGLRGGVFVNQVQALKYALSQTGHRAQAVVIVTEVLELELRDHVPLDAAGPAFQVA
jgi:hypothetical protein